jgi:hypothetical protein
MIIETSDDIGIILPPEWDLLRNAPDMFHLWTGASA